MMPEIIPGIDMILGQAWLLPHRVALDYDTCSCIIKAGRAVYRVPAIAREPVSLATQVVDYCMAVMAAKRAVIRPFIRCSFAIN